MHRSLARIGRRQCAAAAALAALSLVAACADTPSREEQEAARNTIVCKLGGERLVVRYELGEARLLTADGERITLYQVPSASGIRYSNGTIDLRGKGPDMQMARNGAAVALADCQPYTVPK